MMEMSEKEPRSLLLLGSLKFGTCSSDILLDFGYSLLYSWNSAKQPGKDIPVSVVV